MSRVFEVIEMRTCREHGNILLFAYNVVKKVIKTCAHTHTDIKFFFIWTCVFISLSIFTLTRLMTAAVRRLSFSLPPFEVA